MTNNFNAPLKPVKWYKNLATIKGRLESEAFLIEGDRAVKQIVSTYPEMVIEILTTKDLSGIYRGYPERIITENQLHSICSAKTPQGIAAVIKLPLDTYRDYLPQNIGEKVLMLEDIQDPGNVGTLIRTAAAFNYSGVILTEKCADPFSHKCIQSTAGTVLSVWIRRNNKYLDYINTLKERGYSCISADLNGKDNPEVLYHKNRLLLALGNEASGLSKSILNISDYRISIPIVRNNAESLNVAICGAICMYLSYMKQ